MIIAGATALQANAQGIDYSERPHQSVTIAIIPIKPPNNVIYEDSVNYVAYQLFNSLGSVQGIHPLNISHTLRKLNNFELKRYYNRLIKDYRVSSFPDFYNLEKIAAALNADKIMIVTGGFNTQSNMMTRGVKSRMNVFNRYIVKPRYDYNLYIYMFDPLTATIDWQGHYHKQFLFRKITLDLTNTTLNPQFQENFNKFSVKVNTQVSKSLEEHFYGYQTSDVTAKIIKNPPQGKAQATEGAMTTDGQPFISPKVVPEPTEKPEPEFVGPVTKPINETETEHEVSHIIEESPQQADEKEEPVEHSTLDTPYPGEKNNLSATTENNEKVSGKSIDELEPEYEKELLKKYQKHMIQKY